MARLAVRILRRGQAHVARLWGGWPSAARPHGHSHQRDNTPRRGDLARLSPLKGAALDPAFVKVMTARLRAGRRLAALEARDGSVAEVRQLARDLLAEQQAQIHELQTARHR